MKYKLRSNIRVDYLPAGVHRHTSEIDMYKSDQSKHDAAPRIIYGMMKNVQSLVALHHGETRRELDTSLQQLAAVTQQLIASRHV